MGETTGYYAGVLYSDERKVMLKTVYGPPPDDEERIEATEIEEDRGLWEEGMPVAKLDDLKCKMRRGADEQSGYIIDHPGYRA